MTEQLCEIQLEYAPATISLRLPESMVLMNLMITLDIIILCLNYKLQVYTDSTSEYRGYTLYPDYPPTRLDHHWTHLPCTVIPPFSIHSVRPWPPLLGRHIEILFLIFISTLLSILCSFISLLFIFTFFLYTHFYPLLPSHLYSPAPLLIFFPTYYTHTASSQWHDTPSTISTNNPPQH